MFLNSILRVVTYLLMAGHLQSQQVKEDKDYFPLTAYSSYEYSGDFGKTFVMIHETRNNITDFTSTFNGITGYIYKRGKLMVDSTGIIEESTDGSNNGKMNRFIKLGFPIAVGTTWSVSNFGNKLIYKIVSINETVKVPAGIFKGCIKVTANGRFHQWYAPNVGLVKSSTLGNLTEYNIKQKANND